MDPSGTAKVQTNTIQENIKALDKAWRRSSFFIKKKLLRAMFEKVVVSGSKIQISFSTLKTIEISKVQNKFNGVSANEAGASVLSNILDSLNRWLIPAISRRGHPTLSKLLAVDQTKIFLAWRSHREIHQEIERQRIEVANITLCYTCD